MKAWTPQTLMLTPLMRSHQGGGLVPCRLSYGEHFLYFVGVGLRAGMECFRVACALRPSRLNILKYIKDEILLRGYMYSLLCFHYFISPWYKPPSVLPMTAPPKKLHTGSFG